MGLKQNLGPICNIQELYMDTNEKDWVEIPPKLYIHFISQNIHSTVECIVCEMWAHV